MTEFTAQEKRERDAEPHPVWRGIGFLLMVGIPFLSYGIAIELLALIAARGIALPPQLQQPGITVPLLGTIHNWPALAVFTAIVAVILYGVFAVVNAMIYGTSSKSTLRVFESAPKQYKKKRNLKKPRYD
jgi:hypothetical protein